MVGHLGAEGGRNAGPALSPALERPGSADLLPGNSAALLGSPRSREGWPRGGQHGPWLAHQLATRASLWRLQEQVWGSARGASPVRPAHAAQLRADGLGSAVGRAGVQDPGRPPHLRAALPRGLCTAPSSLWNEPPHPLCSHAAAHALTKSALK